MKHFQGMAEWYPGEAQDLFDLQTMSQVVL